MEKIYKTSFQYSVQGLGKLLHKLANEQPKDRGALADLRKGLGQPYSWHPRTAKVVDKAIGYIQLSNTDTNVIYTVATLFALHPVINNADDRDTSSFTRTLNELLVSQGNTSDKDRASIDRRVLRLLSADTEDVAEHLRHLVRYFRNSKVPIYWLDLAKDLHYWSNPEKRVQRKWARDWWGSAAFNTNASESIN